MKGTKFFGIGIALAACVLALLLAAYIKEASTRGIVMVGAAGNQTRRIQKFDNPPLTSDYEDTSDIYDFPASYPEVIAVSATYMKTTGKPSERGDCPRFLDQLWPCD